MAAGFLVPALWSELALHLSIRRFEGPWQFKETMRGIGYTDHMRSILRYGEDAIAPLLRFLAALHQLAVRRLLEAGARVDARDRTGMSALHWAARNGDDKMIALLVSRGANANIEDEAGWTPLDWCLERDRKPAAVLEQHGGRAKFPHRPNVSVESAIVITTGEECLEVEIRHQHFRDPMERNPLVRSGRLERGAEWRFGNTADLLYRTRPCGEAAWGYWKHEDVGRVDRDLAIEVGR